MREPVVFLTSPGGRFDVVERTNILTPRGFMCHLDKLAVLHHHGVHDTEERFVTREETSPTRESIALKHTLARMFGQDLNDSSTLVSRSDIPLEVTSAVTKDSVELVGHELIRREDTEALRVPSTSIVKLASQWILRDGRQTLTASQPHATALQQPSYS